MNKNTHIQVRLRRYISNYELIAEFNINVKAFLNQDINGALCVLEGLGAWCAWKFCILCLKKYEKNIEDPTLSDKHKRMLRLVETAFYECIELLAEKVFFIKIRKDF